MQYRVRFFFKKDLYLAYFQTKTISQLSFIQESACEAVLSLIMLVIAAVYKTKLKHMLYKQTLGEKNSGSFKILMIKILLVKYYPISYYT